MKYSNNDFDYLLKLKCAKFNKISPYKSKSTNLLISKKAKFMYVKIYQEGFFSNYFYGFVINKNQKSVIKLYRPSDGAFLLLGLRMPTLINYIFC
jgi:hypothetical protein